MKTKFYKRLVPIALIASMAVTNVGMTSASAQEVTAGFTQSVEGVNVGLVASNDAAAYGYNSTQTATVSGSEEFKLRVAEASGVTGADFILSTSNDANAETFTAGKIAVGSGEVAVEGLKKEVTFTITKSGLQSGSITAYLGVQTASGVFTKCNDNAITITYTAPAVTPSPTQQAAPAGNSFQIPAGLGKQKTGDPTGYTVGVAKVVANSATTNQVNAADFTAANTVGDWSGAYKGDGTASEQKLTPAGTNAVGHYVIYYTPNGADNKIFVRCLNAEEEGKLPYGEYRSKATLGEKNPSTLLTDAEKTTVANNTKTELQKLFDKKADAWTAVYAGEEKVTKTAAHELDIPAITAVAVNDVLSRDTKLVDSLIAAYDTTQGVTANPEKAFKEQYTVAADPDANPPVVAHNRAEGVPNDLWDNAKSEPTAKGYEALLEILRADPAKYMTAENVNGATSKLYNEFYEVEAVKVINNANETVIAAGPDVTAIQWTAETLAVDSETVTDKSGREKTNYTKASGSAAFNGKEISKKKAGTSYTTSETSAVKLGAKRVKGATATVTNTKASGKFNATVYLKAVLDSYVTPAKGVAAQAANIIFTQPVYITPAEPSRFADVKKLPNGMTAVAEAEAPSGVKEYSLTLDAGKSAKLPFALKDGQEKDLVYEVATGSSGFTVINGTVKGVDANNADLTDKTYVADSTLDANVIKVYSRVKPSICAYVKVKVNAAIKSVRANTNALAIWSNSVQTISLGTVPATKPGDFQYQVVCSDTTNIKLQQVDAEGTASALADSKYVTGNLLQVSLADGKKAADVKKNTTITVKLCDSEGKAVSSGGKEVKPLVIKLNPATAPQDVKSIKTAVKSKEILNNHKVINIPVGGAYNVGFTVAPATADPTIDASSDNTEFATVSGDVITGVAAGSTEVTFGLPVNTNRADGFKSADAPNGTVTYTVNVYNPGSSIVLTDSDYTIKGGFLMTADAAATDCDKTFLAGKDYTMALPTTAGPSEDIVWAANNPAAVKFEVVEDGNAKKLKITPCQTGTFTITGTTKYTKQKLSFKMLVSAANTNTATDNSAVTFSGGTVTPANDETPLDVKIKAGDKINAYYSSGTENVGGAVTFALKTATDKDKLVVAKTGLITGKSAGKVTVVATMAKADKSKLYEKEFTVTVEPATVTPKTPVDDKMYGAVAGDTKGVKLATALNNYDKKTMTLVWYKQNGETQTPITALQDKLSGAVAFADADAGKDFTVYVQPMKKDKTDFTNSDDTIGVPISLGTVRVYGKAVNKADLTNGDKDTKTAIAALGAKVDEKKPANGAGNGHTYYFPVFVSGKGEDVVPDAQAGDMTFTVSNKSLATKVEFIPKSQDISTELKSTTENKMQDTDIVKNYTNAYGFIKVETAAAPGEGTEALSGVVTIKGTVLNSNKAVTLKLNLTGAAKDPATPYNPVEVTKNSSVTGASATFSGVTKLAGEPLADGKLQEELDKLDKGKTFTEYQWVVVKPNSKKYTKDDISDKVKVSSVTGAGETAADVTATIAAAADATEGTYYLAKATIVHKVLTAVEKDEDGKAKADSHAKEDEKAIKYTVELASKTPILVKAAATTGGNGGNG